jgi:MoaA/NifB/PqqE/SkfB family radical SAM enzyme
MKDTEKKPRFLTGWKLAPFKLKYAISLAKYLFHQKRYPLFSMKLMNAYRKINKLELPKITKFNHHYYTAILRVPHWPSKVYDCMVAGGGLNLMASGTSSKTQMDCAILGVSQRCLYHCEHCYEYFNLSGNDRVPVEKWQEVINKLQKRGVSIIVLSGGEPMLRYEELLVLLESSDKNLSDFHIHTSGYGVTAKKARALQVAGLHAAGISLDDFRQAGHDAFRGYPGAWQEALQAIQCFRESGIFPYLNVCLTKNFVKSGGLWELLNLAKDPKVGIMNLLEPRPYGRYMGVDSDELFSDEERTVAMNFFEEANRSNTYKGHPFVSYIHYYERPEYFGCLMGGLSHLYIDSKGNVQPCVYLPVSFGNILKEDFHNIYSKMKKATPGPLYGQCPSICLAKTINTKKNQGLPLPVPYREIEGEWKNMFPH